MTHEELTQSFGQHVSRETFERLTLLVSIVSEESSKQNLISRATVADIWVRHVLDSLQLANFYKHVGPWLDLGTGAGFPGLVIAALDLTEVVLVEERRLRFEFLTTTVDLLGLKNVRVIGSKIERVPSFYAGVISARAFAPLAKILEVSARFCSNETRLILPKGKNAADELASVAAMWHGDFRLEPSVTDSDSSIIIAEKISQVRRS